MDDLAVSTLAEEALALLGTGRQITPFSERHPGLDLPAAYHVAAEVLRRREAPRRARHRSQGRLHRPRDLGRIRRARPDLGLDLGPHGPRRRRPEGRACPCGPARASDRARDRLRPLPRPPRAQHGRHGAPWLRGLGCHSFEVVQSPFPGWRFRALDTVAAFGLHGVLLLGPRRELPLDRSGWLAALSGFERDLLRDREPVDRGRARNVRDGLLEVLRHLAELLAEGISGPPLTAGGIVTTGTVTRAFLVARDGTWSTCLYGLDLPGLSVRFA